MTDLPNSTSKDPAYKITTKKKCVQDPLINQIIYSWCSPPIDPETQKQVITLCKANNKKTLNALFGTALSFGTGGIRAPTGIGPARLNPYTVSAIARGIAQWITKQEDTPSITIGYDCRCQSYQFAKTAAAVFQEKKITVYLFQNHCSTPQLSFTARHLSVSCSIMITASHNPPQDNGIKIYGGDGAQLSPPHDKDLASAINLTAPPQLPPKFNSQQVQWLGAEYDTLYLQALKQAHQRFSALKRPKKRKTLKILFTNLHGTGIRLMEKAIKLSDYNASIHFQSLQSQEMPDGNFPTVQTPNPATQSALILGIERMRSTDSDILLATDPDADRIGIVCLHNSEATHLTGHQIALLIADYQLRRLKSVNIQKPLFIKSVVTTDLLEVMAKTHNVCCLNTPPGFKFIAQEINKNNPSSLLLAAEESCGYLTYPFVRDKDGHQAALLIAEYALLLKDEAKTLITRLEEINALYGCYKDALLEINIGAKTHLSTQQMKAFGDQVLDYLLSNPPIQLGSEKVRTLEDGRKIPYLGMRQSASILVLKTQSHKVAIRVSGTEPKLKVYLQTKIQKDKNHPTQYCELDLCCLKKLNKLSFETTNLINSLPFESLLK